MRAVKGVVKDRRVVIEVPADWPEGTPVEGISAEMTPSKVGIREEDWPATPGGITRLLARMDATEPGWLSSEDEAAWKAALQEQKGYEKARFFDDAGKLERGQESVLDTPE